MTLNPDKQASSTTNQVMPALFVGHGTPMNAIEENEFSQTWRELGRNLPRPKSILVISAHWETAGTQVTAMPNPRTIYDFGGFPRQLSEYKYPAVGSPELVEMIGDTVKLSKVQPDHRWGLDHGTWSILAHFYPQADIPVVQMSLDQTKGPEYHYALGKELRALRQQGVLIIGSGNIVHNLRMVSMEGRNFNIRKGHDWAVEFDEAIKESIVTGNHTDAVDYQKLGRPALLSVNSAEHYLPLLYILGLQEEQDRASFFNDVLIAGSLSMRSVLVGRAN
jgi:4,5-DOPA dioxygenase extradiol